MRQSQQCNKTKHDGTCTVLALEMMRILAWEVLFFLHVPLKVAPCFDCRPEDVCGEVLLSIRISLHLVRLAHWEATTYQIPPVPIELQMIDSHDSY